MFQTIRNQINKCSNTKSAAVAILLICLFLLTSCSATQNGGRAENDDEIAIGDKTYSLDEESIDIENMDLRDVPVAQFEKMENLRILTINHCTLKRDQSFADLVSALDLEMINIKNTPVQDISCLASQKRLEHLLLMDTEVSDLSALPEFNQLTTLFLVKNQNLHDFTPIKDMSGLVNLNLSGGIGDLSVLSGLTSLRRLELYGLQVDDYTPLSTLTDLEFLALSDSNFTDLSVLDPLEKLQFLELPMPEFSMVEGRGEEFIAWMEQREGRGLPYISNNIR